jgi:aminoglycoside 3-N-acetyltransferase
LNRFSGNIRQSFRIKFGDVNMEEPKHITKNMIKDCLAELGIVEGDTVFFHSSMKSIGYIEGGADTVLDAFLETIGNTGTLALPGLCMYDFAQMDMEAIVKAWDIINTPTYTGAIPETFRKRPGTLRSDNPTHSVTAVGRYAEEITQDHINAFGAEDAEGRPIWASRGAFGKDSPWDKLYKLDAKYLLIGVGFYNCTLLHHVQIVFWEDYLKPNNPHAPWPILDFHKMGDRLDESGIVKIGMIGNSFTRLIGSKDMVDTAVKIMADGGP